MCSQAAVKKTPTFDHGLAIFRSEMHPAVSSGCVQLDGERAELSLAADSKTGRPQKVIGPELEPLEHDLQTKLC